MTDSQTPVRREESSGRGPRGLIRRALVVSLLAALLAPATATGPAAASSEDGPRFPAAASADETADASEAAEPSDADFAEVAAVARRDGSVQVIVGLHAGFSPEGHQSQSNRQAQRARIAREAAAVRHEAGGAQAREVRSYETLPYVVLSLTEPAVEALRRSGRASSITIDEPVEPMLAASTPLVQADQVWASGLTGAGTTVAVLDTGVDRAHPFFGGRVVEEACYSTTSPGFGSTTLCPNGTSSQTGPGSGVHCTVHAGCRHGTHVAGIVAGHGSTRSGVARGANLMSVQVFSQGPDGLLAFNSDILAGLERVYQRRSARNIVAVNLSFGGDKSTTHCDGDPRKAAVDNLRSVGVATIAATGNESYTDGIARPACISSVVAVGSTTLADAVSSFSNGHPTLVDLLAPGDPITSAVPGTGFTSFRGTSMATPQVAGAWALIREHRPDATVDEVLTALRTTGVPITDTRGSTQATHPRIRILDAIATGLPPSTTPTTPSAPRNVGAARGDRRVSVTFGAPTWDGGAPILTYQARCVGGGITRATSQDASSWAASPGPLTVTGLTNGTTYQCAARARNEVGWSTWSPSVSAKPAVAPSGVSLRNPAPGDRRITATARVGSDGGEPVTTRQLRCTSAATGTTRTASSNSHRITVTGLTNGVRYSCRARARNAVGWSGWSLPLDLRPQRATPPPSGFVDVPRSAYFAVPVDWLAHSRITTGVAGTNRFDPHGLVTRGQMAAFLWRLAGQPRSGGANFADVAGGAYYAEATRWLRRTGITTGVGGSNRFDPNAPVTRAQMVTFLHRFAGNPSVPRRHGFVDVHRNSFYDGAVSWAAHHRITTGVAGSNRFDPNGVVTRGQMAAFLHRFALAPAASGPRGIPVQH